jgi:hypothetical protein
MMESGFWDDEQCSVWVCFDGHFWGWRDFDFGV